MDFRSNIAFYGREERIQAIPLNNICVNVDDMRIWKVSFPHNVKFEIKC